MIFPFLPVFVTTVLGAGPAFLGIVEGTADTMSALLRLPFGWLSDRMRRKPLVVAGYAIANLVRPVLALATAPWHVLAVRVLDRVGKGVRTAPRDALLADSVSEKDRGRAFGFHRSMDHGGAVIGPLIASLLFVALDRDYRWLFLFASLPGLFTILYTMTRVEETPTRSPRVQPSALDFGGFDRSFFGLIAAVFVFGLGASSDAFLLLQLHQAGVDAALLPFLWAALHVVKVASVYPLGLLSDRVGRLPLIVAGWAYYAVVYLGFAVAENVAVLAVIFVAYGVFYGLTEGAERALVGDLVAPDRRGAAFGIYNAAIGVTALPASVLMGVIWEVYGKAAAFGFGATMAAVATLVLLSRLSGSRSAPSGS